eukprot:CAMPEP_0119418002 /NCGR_PEP_ID=MMETSP1335-20130426/17186_1 /TAXON_ID=259385 /ORGANISM="Chrysoculter rhomboideus, Strain RCC1486" /LENGTH=179 /DNA_ID=CAMNT_0007443217 /DNA_START=12 /DNA_END=551 /DNA_ORIENTATION=+
MVRLGCPVPHKLRDQVWLGVGVGVGVAIAWWFRQRTGWGRHNSVPPAVLPMPPPVVQTAQFTIRESCGRASTGDERLSIAHVRVGEPCQEAIQTPAFDEYVLVLWGAMKVYVGSHTRSLRPRNRKRDEPFELLAGAGDTLWLPRGHRYRYTFPEKCEYVAVCLPAFSPSIASREEDAEQ